MNLRREVEKRESIVKASLDRFLPEAAEVVWQEFCIDCPNRPGCIQGRPFCYIAQVMTKVCLNAVVANKAREN